LATKLKLTGKDLFRTRAELIEEAYEAQSARIAYSRPNPNQ
jgi:hypothetical protein